MSEGLPDDFPQPEPAGGLSGGEIAAIVVLLTLAAIAALVVGIIVVIYYIQRRRRKYHIPPTMNPNVYGTYLSDADTFNRATTTQKHGKEQLLESQTMVMMSKEGTLPVQSLVATNLMAAEDEADERAETEEGDQRVEGVKTKVVKGDEDTHL